MSLTNSLPRRAGRAALFVLSACILVALVSVGVAGAAKRKAHHHHHHHRHQNVARAIGAAARARTRADHALVQRAHAVKRCVRRHPRHCAAQRRALQRAGLKLSRINHRLNSLVAGQGRLGRASSIRRAPLLRVVGRSITWRRIRHVRSYVVFRRVPGQSAQYTITRNTRVTPPAVPGATVRFSVRTNVSGSAWSPEVTIAYPAPAPTPAPAPAPVRSPSSPPPGQQKPSPKPPAVDTTTAPTVAVSGQTLKWNQIGNVTTYVLMASTAGKTDQYSEVSGTSVTPAAVPGATVKYSVRTAVNGSAWSVPVSITYPSAPAPAPAPSPSAGPFVVGLNAGNYGTTGVNDVKNAVDFVRLDSGIGGTAIRNYENAGVKVDLLVAGPYSASGISSIDPTTWASSALSFYSSNCSTSACPWPEVLNEPYWPRWWGSNATSQANADAYARLLKATYEAFHNQYGSNAPKILASCEDQSWNGYWCDRWRNSTAVSNPVQYVDGVTVHPYGGTSDRTQSALGSRAEVSTAHNATGRPVFVTEVGWPTATQCSSTGDSFQWSESAQAANITNFMDWARSTGYVSAVTYFNYHDFGSCDWYGVVRSDGSHKPGYAALQAEAAK